MSGRYHSRGTSLGRIIVIISREKMSINEPDDTFPDGITKIFIVVSKDSRQTTIMRVTGAFEPEVELHDKVHQAMPTPISELPVALRALQELPQLCLCPLSQR